MGMFDDLVPAQQTEQGAAGGLFDDLIPPSPPPAAVDTKKYPYSAENPPPPPKRVRHKEHPTYVSEYIDEAGRAVARGATNFVGQIYKGASAGSLSDTQEADSVAAEFQNIPKMDDAQFAQFYARALKLAHKNPDAQRAIGESVRMVRNGQAAPNQALGWRQMLDTRTPQETAEFKTGQAIQDYAQRQFPQAPEFKDSWTSTIAEAGGSTLPYLATALAGPLSLPLGMLAGIKSGEGEALDRALQHPGTTNKQVLDAATWGAIPGATEQLPIEYLLRRIPVPVANKFGKLVVELGKQAFAEGGQEAVNQLGQNLVENYVYNPDKDLTEGVLEAAGIGAIVGGTMQVAVDGGASITDKIIGKPKDPGTTAAPGKTDRQTRTANTDGFSVQSKGQRIEPRLFDDLIPETQQNPASDAKSDNLTETRQFVRLSEMDETDILRQTGYSLEQIADMNPAERAQAAQEARQQGIEPIGTIAPGAPPVGTSATAPGFGTRKQRASIQTDQDMAAVRPVVNAQPSEAQAAAGNYQKGHINLHGLDISIENPKGSVRRGTDPDTGEAWQSPSLPADYGYVKGTKGKDGDHVDVYIGPNPQSDRVYVIDQVNLKDGKFDEHKAVLAANSPQEAVDLYVNSFDVPTLDRIGDVTEMSVDEFKAWSKNGRATKRPAGQIPQQIQPDRLKVTEQAPVEPVDTAQSLATADKAFDSYMASRKPLTPEGFAAASGLDVKAAGRAIQRAALAGRVIQTRSGKWMRAPQRSTPINAVEFIASLGGIQDVTGELAGMDLPKMTPYGPVVRKTGLHPDKVREALVEAGYLQDAGRDTGGQAQTTVDDVYQLLDAHMRGQKAYSVQDQAWADDVAATKRNEQLDPEWRPIHPVAQIHGLETWEKVQAFFADSGTSEETWSPQEVSDAARLVAGGMDAGDAFERAAFLQIEERANPIDPEAEFPEVIEWMRARDQYAMELFGDPPPFPDVEQPRAAQPEAVEEESNGGAQPVQQAGSEPADQADVAGDGAEDAGTGEVRSEETGQDGTAVEPGADNLPQTVLPGAEAVSEADATKAAKAEKARKELEARRKQSKLRKSGQTSVEDQAGGLFGGKGPKQSSLLDATSQTELAEAKPNSGSDKPDSVSREANPTPSKIEDFGEKITGARKDAVRDIVKTLSDNLDVTTEPLSKTFPQPDYVKMAEAGVDREALAYVALFRAEIPTKPQKSWKVKQWSEQVKILRDFSHNLLTGELSAAAIRKKIYDDMPILAKVARTAEIIKDIEPKYLAYASQYSVASSQVSYLRGQQFKPAKQMFLLETDKQRWTNVDAEKLEDLREPALAFIRKKAEAELRSDGEGKTRRTPLLLYKDRFTKDIFIGFKGRIDVIRLKTGFKESKEARLYMADHADELQAQIDAMREEPDLRRAANAPRSGPPRRPGDATPEQFQEAFGFRGVQFGNYVEGDRRQSDLNEAFDALMDLADTLGIPSQALSLGGKLGLAFGARGHGGKRAAAAHYEPSQIVINLTKHAGPGSLAHEWLHAFDHYFARLNSGSDGRAYISEAKKRGEAREPVWQAWKAIEKAISSGTFAKRSDELDKARSKAYYGTTIEKAARAFERYIVDRLAENQTNNDYLANIDTSGGAYPTEQEMQEAGIRKAFDDMFAAIEVTKNERGQAVLSSRRLSSAVPDRPIFYSGLLRAVESLKQDKAPAAQWLGTIRNTPGVKPEEVAWLGLDDWLSSQTGTVTKAQIADFVRANQVQVSEVEKGRAPAHLDQEHQRLVDERSRLAAEYEDLSAIGAPTDELVDRMNDLHDRIRDIEETETPAPKFEQYQLPGGENYRELLLTLPQKNNGLPPGFKTFQDAEAPNRWGIEFPDGNRIGGWRTEADAIASQARQQDSGNYRSGHWDEPNVVAHVRFNERTVPIEAAASVEDIGERIRQSVGAPNVKSLGSGAPVAALKKGVITEAEAAKFSAAKGYLNMPFKTAEKVLFIEEIQSDWHQAGRKKGYRATSAKTDTTGWTVVRQKNHPIYGDTLIVSDADGNDVEYNRDTSLTDQAAIDQAAYAEEVRNSGRVPDAPFKTTWPELAMKRMVRWAAQNGFDRIAWTPGDVQAERYDLSKQISKVTFKDNNSGGIGLPRMDGEPSAGMLTAYDMDGRPVIDKYVEPEQIEDYIGKDLAKKLLVQPGKRGASAGMGHREKTLEGLDLKVGGEGMAGFYDKMLVDTARKLGKKFGATVGRIALPGEKANAATGWESTDARVTDAPSITVHSLDITPAMRTAVMEGQPLFRLRPNKFRYAISDKQRRAVVADVQQAAQRILGHHLQKVMTANDLEPFGFSSDEDGVFDPNTGVIWIALQGAQDPRSTIRHEAIHALRQAGVFTKPEWAALSRMAASQWIDRYNIRDRYEQLYRERFDLTDAQIEELLTEEAVADAFADHMDSPRGEDVIARIFEKLRRFLEAVRSALKGQGFTTASQVFGDIDRGVMGRRDAGAGTSREFMLYGRQGSQGPLSSRGRQAPPRNPAQGSFQPLHEQPMEAWRDDTLRYWGAGQKIDQAIRAAGQERYVLLKDRHVAISRMVEAAERAIGRKLPDHMDPFLASRLFAGRMPEAVRQFEENEVQPLVAAMAERRITPEELGQWLSAHHAEERNMHLGQYFKPGDPFHDAITDPTQIGASGWSTDQAIEVKQRFAHRAKAFGHVAEMVYRMQDQALDLRLRAGLIDQATHDRLHRDGSNAVYQFYVPQQGFEAEPDNAEFIPGVGAGFDLRSPEFIRAMGRRSRADNPLAYIVSSAKKGIIRAEKARVDRSLMLFIQNFPNPDLYELNKVNMKRAFSTDAQGNVTIENARDRSADHDDNVLVVKIGGKSYRITFSSTPAGNKLARAFKNLEAAQLGTFTAFMHKAVRMWAQLNTSRDPQFLLKNFNIDTITALINVSSESPKDRKARVASSMVRSVGSAIRGMNRHLQGKHDTEWSRHAKEFAANGGKMEFLGLMGIEAEKKMFDRTYRQQTERLPMTKRMAYDFTIGRLERWNDALENAWRLSAYVALRNNGVSANRAAQAARDLTVDFAVHGEKGPMINAFYAFFNATAEGQINLVKRYVYNKYTRRIMNGLILMGFMQTLLNYWIAGDDDDGEDKYQKIPDFVKLNNFVFMVPEFVPEQYRPQSGYVTYPARGWNIFHVIGQMAAETVVGGRTPEEAAAIAGTAMLEFANPMGSSGSLLNIMAPTFIDPIVDIENNKNFMGQQIVPDYGVFDKRPDSEKYRETTSEAFRAPAQLLNEQTGGSDTRPGKISISPETLEHWYEFATGGLGRLLSRSWNTIENFSVDEPLDPEKLPFARLYLGQDKSFEERNIYYEIRDKVDVTKRELDARKDDGDTDEESRVARTYAREVSMIKAVTDAERDMAKLRKERKAIKGNQQMGAKAKREAIEAVDMEMDAIMLYVRKQWNTWTPPVEAVQ